LYVYIYFVVGGNVHVKILELLSLGHGLSPGAKEHGEVMWPSPPHFFAAPLLRYRDPSLPVVPFSLAFALHAMRCASPA
jgi:hypothetical protein